MCSAYQGIYRYSGVELKANPLSDLVQEAALSGVRVMRTERSGGITYFCEQVSGGR